MFLAIENGCIGSSEPNIRYELTSSAKDAAFHDPTQISDQALAFSSAVHICDIIRKPFHKHNCGKQDLNLHEVTLTRPSTFLRFFTQVQAT